MAEAVIGGKTLPVPRHIAIIMDGNGRWAKNRGLPRTAGHAAGGETFRKIANYCRSLGVEYLTVYAFSTENWKRPEKEISGLMTLLGKYIREGLREEAREKGEFSEKGFKQDGQKQEKKDAGDRYRTEGRKKGMSASAVALIVICCLVASPVLIPLAITLIVVLAVLGAVFISLVLVFLLVGVVCIVSGVIAFFGSLTELFLAPASAVMGIGMSLIAVGAGILLTMLLVFVISKIFPAAFCKTADWVSGLFHKKGGKKG